LINVPDRLLCVSLIREAAQSGCRLEKACDELGLSLRTFQRWVGDGDAMLADGRTTTARPPPRNKLSEVERHQILEVANCAEFASLPPSQIVPSLADRGVYVASESSFYRVLRSASQQHHRGRARKPSTPGSDQSLCDGTESGLVVGHHVDAGGGQGPVLLLVHDAGCVQS
jgi:putative transposase